MCGVLPLDNFDPFDGWGCDSNQSKLLKQELPAPNRAAWKLFLSAALRCVQLRQLSKKTTS